ncbi:hypothetical protein EBZ39_03145 [bacterium]|nr:hypothetical protein [bacterium]
MYLKKAQCHHRVKCKYYAISLDRRVIALEINCTSEVSRYVSEVASDPIYQTFNILNDNDVSGIVGSGCKIVRVNAGMPLALASNNVDTPNTPIPTPNTPTPNPTPTVSQLKDQTIVVATPFLGSTTYRADDHKYGVFLENSTTPIVTNYLDVSKKIAINFQAPYGTRATLKVWGRNSFAREFIVTGGSIDINLP